ncbi:MAG: sporulation protein [Acidobacteriota bacterium]|nr:sporulation protein [Acidobacteriota bacterium]
MSFMKRMLSSVGIGSAKVDTVLYESQFVPGEEIEAVVKIKAGKVEQQIDEIYFSLHCNYLVEGENDHEERTTVLEKYHMGESLNLSPGETTELPVNLTLPYDVPLSLGRSKVWIQTGLDIKSAVDPSDRDVIEIVPDELMGGFFGAVEALGFELVDAECEAVRPGFSNRLPFVQELEFKPTRGDFRGRLDELEIIYFHRGSHLEIRMEVDRRARGFSGFMSEMLETDETQIRFEVTSEDLNGLADNLYDLIDRYC